MNKHDSMEETINDLNTTDSNVIENPWRKLRGYTNARIGLGRAGVSLPTHELLAFQLDHAQARDAVHMPLNIPSLQQQLNSINELNQIKQCILHSKAINRVSYLQRPDLGRRLDESSQQQLKHFTESSQTAFDLAIVIVDGLSSKAVQQNTAPFIETLLNHFANDAELKGLQLAPITIVEQGRVAIGDEIGELLNAKLAVVLIGERPGLSSPDSLGLYLTWEPTVGRNDSQRNCISNIRPAGLSYEDASQKALYLIKESNRLKLTGVNLKDRSNEKSISNQIEQKNFLIE